MKPPAFQYHRARSVDEAIALLAQHGTDAKLLAGGQSLLPMMKLRLARPTALIDIGQIADLAYVQTANGAVRFGAMARLADLETERVRSVCPALGAAAEHIGHGAIRNWGTVCGSLAHADPAAELPVLALAMNATLEARGPAVNRTIPADDFFVTYLTTALEPAEILVAASFPRLPPGTGWGFHELSRRKGDFALVIAAAVVVTSPTGIIESARIVLGAVADRPVRCPDAEAAIVGQHGDPGLFRAAGIAAADPLAPPSDVHGSGAYRRRVAAVLAERAITDACRRAISDGVKRNAVA